MGKTQSAKDIRNALKSGQLESGSSGAFRDSGISY